MKVRLEFSLENENGVYRLSRPICVDNAVVTYSIGYSSSLAEAFVEFLRDLADDIENMLISDDFTENEVDEIVKDILGLEEGYGNV